jgi:hypothetical protein
LLGIDRYDTDPDPAKLCGSDPIRYPDANSKLGLLGHKIGSKSYGYGTMITSSVADPDPGSGVFLTPGSGMGKKSRSGSGMNIPNYNSESLETIFG